MKYYPSKTCSNFTTTAFTVQEAYILSEINFDLPPFLLDPVGSLKETAPLMCFFAQWSKCQ